MHLQLYYSLILLDISNHAQISLSLSLSLSASLSACVLDIYMLLRILNFLFIKESWIKSIKISTKILSSTTVLNIDNNNTCFLSIKSS